jgi:hypothetical protein
MKPTLIALALCASLIDLVPLMFSIPLLHSHAHGGDNDRLIRALNSPQTEKCILFLFATTIPMMADCLGYFYHRDDFYYVERVIILLAFTIPLLVLLGMHADKSASADGAFTSDDYRIGDVLLCLMPITSVWTAGAMLSGVLKSQSAVWTSARVHCLFSIVCFVQALVPFTELRAGVGYPLLVVCNVGFIIGFLFVLYHYVWYLFTVWIKLPFVSRNKRGSGGANGGVGDHQIVYSSEYLPLLCSTMIVCYCIAFMAGSFAFNITFPRTIGSVALVFNLTLIGVVTIIVTLLPGRIARYSHFHSECGKVSLFVGSNVAVAGLRCERWRATWRTRNLLCAI